MKKNKKKTFILLTLLTLIGICLTIWLKQYKWRYYNDFNGDIINGNAYFLSYINIKPYQDKKIVIDLDIQSGDFYVEFYKIPENHVAQKFKDADMIQAAKLIEKGIKIPTTSEGMEFMESYTYSESGTYEIDTSDWDLGYYGIVVDVSDTHLQYRMDLKIKVYNWQMVKKRFLVWKNTLEGKSDVYEYDPCDPY